VSSNLRHVKTISLALLVFILPVLVGAGNASTPDGNEPVAYGCGEVVVVGRVKTVAYADLTSGGDVLGHDRYDMQLRIKRVLRGKETRRVVPVSGFSHGQLREDVDLWLVLTPANGAYAIRTGNLARIPHRFASKCG
jgi:hypothetical protein